MTPILHRKMKHHTPLIHWSRLQPFRYIFSFRNYFDRELKTQYPKGCFFGVVWLKTKLKFHYHQRGSRHLGFF